MQLVRFEVFTAVTMKNAVFWDMAPGCFRLVTQVCSHLLTLGPCWRIFLPRRWRRYVPPKRRFTQYLHGVTSQKTEFFTHATCFLKPLKVLHVKICSTSVVNAHYVFRPSSVAFKIADETAVLPSVSSIFGICPRLCAHVTYGFW
jgi:hypothetical protein